MNNGGTKDSARSFLSNTITNAQTSPKANGRIPTTRSGIGRAPSPKGGAAAYASGAATSRLMAGGSRDRPAAGAGAVGGAKGVKEKLKVSF